MYQINKSQNKTLTVVPFDGLCLQSTISGTFPLQKVLRHVSSASSCLAVTLTVCETSMMLAKDWPRKPYLFGADFNADKSTHLLVACFCPSKAKSFFITPLPLSITCITFSSILILIAIDVESASKEL